MMAPLSALLSIFVWASLTYGVPLPNARQLEFMEEEFMTFFHFSLPTFWSPPFCPGDREKCYLYTSNPTYHNCYTTSIDHTNSTGAYYPCLDPALFAPTNFSADDWMEYALALGSREICLTAHHEGGFALWPSNYTKYSVALAKNWRGGGGDVLRDFADAANRAGIKICYYLNVQNNGYLNLVEHLTPEAFIEAELGMVREVLSSYGPVNRFWFDGTEGVPGGTNLTDLWARVYDEIRAISPSTLISPYKGDVCASTSTLYTNSGPQPNSTDTSACASASESGEYFYPNELHGITIQEGPDGNTDATPTFWFWHPWACAGNTTDCLWIGHGNASRIFNSYLYTVGHGAVLNMNCPAERTGRMNESVAAVMVEAGLGLNATFKGLPVAGFVSGTINTTVGVPLIIELPTGGGQPFDYVVSMEDLRYGQRIANYSYDYQRVGSDVWEVLIPPVLRNGSNISAASLSASLSPSSSGLGDRPDGSDPRDSHVGRKRIDFPIVNTSSTMSGGGAVVPVARIRFNCIRALEEPVYLRSVTLRRQQVPWIPSTWDEEAIANARLALNGGGAESSPPSQTM